MGKPVFCIIGKSGSGKSTYLDIIMNNDMVKGVGVKELKYHTTRKKRFEAEDSYIFVTYDQYLRDFIGEEDPILEERHYSKFDEDVIYYTLKSDIDNSDSAALICAASVDQVLSYYYYLDNVYIINVVINDTKERLHRLINRCNTEDEVYEVCRRTLEENKEYNKFNPDDFGARVITIDNSISDTLDNDQVIAKNSARITKIITKIVQHYNMYGN